MIHPIRMTHSAVLTALLLLVVLPSSRAVASVYDDAVAWWHFDYDPNTNGFADLDEIRDQRDWGTASSKGPTGKHATAIRGAAGGPQWVNTPVPSPSGGQNYGSKSIYFQTAVNAATNGFPDTFSINNLQLAGSVTVVTRFRWDGYPTELQKTSWLLNTGMVWDQYIGWLFGISSNGYPRLQFYSQKSSYQMNFAMTNGLWYEAAMVVTDGGLTNPTDTVEFYLWPQNNTLKYEKFTSTVITNVTGTAGLTVGCENAATGYAGGNNLKSFIGAVNHLAVWNRPLSYAEIGEAFGHPQPLFQIGINNNLDSDLRLESETDATYVFGDPWHTQRRAVSAYNPEASIKIPLTDVQTNLNYVFHLNTLNTSQTNLKAKLLLVVNTTTNPVQSAGQNQDLFWPITKSQLIAGTNTFTLCYAGGNTPYVTFDWMELGGSWQIGFENNTQAEFVMESSVPDNYFVTDPNWKHVERAVSYYGTNTHVLFTLSNAMRRTGSFSYTTRIISQGDGGTNHAFSIGLNDTVLQRFAPQTNGTYVTLPLDTALIRPGNNAIKLFYDSPYVGYLQFDFHRLDVAPWVLPWPSGSLFSLQ